VGHVAQPILTSFYVDGDRKRFLENISVDSELIVPETAPTSLMAAITACEQSCSTQGPPSFHDPQGELSASENLTNRVTGHAPQQMPPEASLNHHPFPNT
jgi:hypothetical protein